MLPKVKRLSGAESTALRAEIDRRRRAQLEPELHVERCLGLRCQGCDGALDGCTSDCRTCHARFDSYRRGRRSRLSSAEAQRLFLLADTTTQLPMRTALIAPPRRTTGLELVRARSAPASD